MSQLNVAEKIIKKCGGAQALAEALGIAPSTVHKWSYPKEREGQGGLVPAKYQQPVLDFAKGRGIEISPADFFASREG